MSFEVTVVIPVFNAEAFIERAIISVLAQLEVKEVIIVNDGSSDNSLAIINEYKDKDKRVKVLHHKNKQNRGRSKSRNLGILNSKSKYIAFLDADDFYLEDRFKNDKLILKNNEKLDGVYNAVGYSFYREATLKEKKNLTLNTLTKKVPPNLLFDALISGRYGYIHINGLTLKRDVFKTIGLFNPNLKVAEDTDVFWKMALKCTIFPGILTLPVAKRGVHNTNVFNDLVLYDKYNLKLFESVLFWSCDNKISISNIERIIEKVWILKSRQTNSVFKKFFYWFFLTFKSKNIFFSTLTLKYFPLIRYRKQLFSFLYS